MGSFFITSHLIAAEQVAPSLELLEFLADSVEVEKELLDPINLQEMLDDDKPSKSDASTKTPIVPTSKQAAP